MKQRQRSTDNGSYPPVVITDVGWALLIGKGPDEVCLSFAIPEHKQGKTVGCCMNIMLPVSVVVDWSPIGTDLNLYPNVSIGEGDVDTSSSYLSRIEGRWSVISASRSESGGVSVLESVPD